MGKRLWIERWSDGRHFLVSVIAQHLALSADALHEVCLLAREGSMVNGAGSGTSGEEWYKLYRDKDRVISETIGGFLKAGTEGGEDLVSWLARLQCAADKVSALGEDEIRQELSGLNELQWKRRLEEGAEICRRVKEAHIEHLRETVAEETPELKGVAELLEKPEVLFFFRVWLPCWIEYGEALPHLLRKARSGDADAIENLLRLDSRAIEDPQIREHYHGAVDENMGGRMRVFTKGLENGPRRELPRKRVKMMLGALMYKMSGELAPKVKGLTRRLGIVCPKVKLSYADIRRLFDFLAKDQGRGLRDSDLQIEDHSFATAIRRARKLWPERVLISQK